MIRWQFTSTSAKALVGKPHDRTGAAKALVEGFGGKLNSYYLALVPYRRTLATFCAKIPSNQSRNDGRLGEASGRCDGSPPCLGQVRSVPSGAGRSRNPGSPSASPSHAGQSSGSKITGMRSCSSAISALAAVVMIQKLRVTVPSGHRTSWALLATGLLGLGAAFRGRPIQKCKRPAPAV